MESCGRMISIILSDDPEYAAWLEQRFQELLAADEQQPTTAFRLTQKGEEIAARMRSRRKTDQERAS